MLPRPHRRVVLALAALISALAPPARAGHDEASHLYSTGISFTEDGQPVVGVGLMEGQTEVTIESPTGLVLSLSGDGGARIRVPARKGLRFRVADPVPGRTQYRIALDSAPTGDLAGVAAARQRWSDRGLDVEVLELGSIVGYPGRMLDNRRSFVAEAVLLDDAASARARAQEFAERWNLDKIPGVHAVPIERARGAVVATDIDSGLEIRQADLLTLTAAGGGAVHVRRVEYARGYDQHGFENRSFHGTIIVAIDSTARLAVINRVPAEEMLRGLVPAETFPSAPAAALEAQAVTARAELLAKIGLRHLADPFQVCSEQHCQVYAGRSKEKPTTDAAVQRTRGLMLFDADGHLVDSVYSASCGGHTESNENVWGGTPRESLRGRADARSRGGIPWEAGTAPSPEQLRRFLANPPASWCASTTKGSGAYRWQRVLPSAELDRMVNARHDVGHVRAVEVVSRGVSGRVRAVRFVGDRGEAVVARELSVRRLLGNLRSGMFVVDQERGGWVFTGGGYGHGVGMCQYGAIGMAEAGASSETILRHYYQGAKVEKVY